MDDAGAVIFLELARTAGVRLLSMGTHACSTDAASPLRHAWGSTSPVHSAGGLLASQLLQRQGSFSITESFLEESPEESALTSWSAPGFSSYRFTEPDAIHMHCSGLSLPEGGRLLGLETTEGWVSIPPHACRRDSVTCQSGELGGIRRLCRDRFGAWRGLSQGILFRARLRASVAERRADTADGTVCLFVMDI